MPPANIGKIIAGAMAIFILVVIASSSTYVVEAGNRGVQVTLGHVSEIPKPEGFGFKLPFITQVHPVTVRQQTEKFIADCYSSDLQQIKVAIRVLYRIPENKVVTLFRDYHGDPFNALIQPRVGEAVKELAALRSAELIVQKREELKSGSLIAAREKLGDLLILEDVVLEDLELSPVLERAIESKMVQEQEAARARFAQQQAEVEANTVVIKARGEAESINLRGKALRENPNVIALQIVEQWDGITPLVVGPSAEAADMLLPLGSMSPRTNNPAQP